MNADELPIMLIKQNWGPLLLEHEKNPDTKPLDCYVPEEDTLCHKLTTLSSGVRILFEMLPSQVRVPGFEPAFCFHRGNP